jgi:16S rRNA (adenine1518-N6/adenine1519-N6)-dimethyltransferase
LARQRLGQHFLSSPDILDRIARAACPQREPLVVEIGPGRGALTAHLVERAERLIAVELDGSLAAHLRGQYAGQAEIVEGDAVRIDLGQWGAPVIAGNLPYYAATPIIDAALSLGPRLVRGVLLIQKEVALRLAASPGSRDYGYLSVATQLRARVDRLFDVKPGSFRPPPHVDSSVVRLTPHRPEWAPPDQAGFLSFVSAAFAHKRKTLKNNLAALYSKEAIDELGTVRAEEMGPAELAALYAKLADRRFTQP